MCFRDCVDCLALLKEGIRQELPLASVIESRLSDPDNWSADANTMLFKLLRFTFINKCSVIYIAKI